MKTDTPHLEDGDHHAIYEPKDNPKVIRVLTVLGYVVSVSLIGLVLSLYYIFLWKPSQSSAHVPNFPVPESGYLVADEQFREPSGILAEEIKLQLNGV